MNDQYNPFANNGIGGGLLDAGLWGLSSQQASSQRAYEDMKRLAKMQQACAQPSEVRVQPPAPNPVLLLCGDEE